MPTPYFRDVSLFIVIAWQKLKVSSTPPRKRTNAHLVGRIGPSRDTHCISIVCRGYLYRSMAVRRWHEVEKRRVRAMVQQPSQCNKPAPLESVPMLASLGDSVTSHGYGGILISLKWRGSMLKASRRSKRRQTDRHSAFEPLK